LQIWIVDTKFFPVRVVVQNNKNCPIENYNIEMYMVARNTAKYMEIIHPGNIFKRTIKTIGVFYCTFRFYDDLIVNFRIRPVCSIWNIINSAIIFDNRKDFILPLGKKNETG